MFPLSAQEFGFGFGDDAETEGGSTGGGLGRALSVSISGEVSAELLGFYNDFSHGAENVNLGDILSGKLNFSAGIPVADAVINLKLEPTVTPLSIDEAYVRAFFGSFEVEGGLRKLTWGKADSFGALDIINPLDYSELTDLGDLSNFKIARPLVHLTYRIGSFSKIEGVFVPTFEPLRFAESGSRWRPAQMVQIDQLVQLGQMQVTDLLPPDLLPQDFQLPELPAIALNFSPNTSTLNYAQGGIRFTTTVGSADIGAQYYYGRLTSPAIKYDQWTPYDVSALGLPIISSLSIPMAIDFVYNPYHQIGIDWAQVLFGFNVRAEFAANITYDFAGDDGSIYNPHLVWSLGFDRDLVWGINLNIQCNETIRLMNDKITNDTLFKKMISIPLPLDIPGMPPLDIEGGTDMTSTQIIAALTKSFFKDELTLRAAIFWEIEAKDFMFIPSLVWTKDALSVELSAGIFGGDEGGQFGQYWNNSFVKAVLTYSF
jgi:hypothetical protein